MHQIAECVRHSIGQPLLNARRLNRRHCSRTAGVLRGLGRFLRFFGRRRLGRLSLSLSIGFDGAFRGSQGAFAVPFSRAASSLNRSSASMAAQTCSTQRRRHCVRLRRLSRRRAELVEAGVDGAVAIGEPTGLIACEAADGVAVFGVSARGGVEGGEAGVDGAVAIGGPSGLIACEAADGAAVFGVSARGGVEGAEAGADGAVAIGGPSGLIACEAADGLAVFGASARGGVETGEAGLSGAVAIGAPSGLIACEAADGLAVFGASTRGGAELGEAASGRRCCNWRPVRPDPVRGHQRGGLVRRGRRECRSRRAGGA